MKFLQRNMCLAKQPGLVCQSHNTWTDRDLANLSVDLQLLIISTETVMMEGEDFAEHLSCSLLPCRYKSWVLEVKAFALDYAFIYRGGQNPGVLTTNYYFFLHGVLQMSKCPPKQFSAMLSYSSSNGSRLQKKTQVLFVNIRTLIQNININNYTFIFFYYFFFASSSHMELPRPGMKSELQL